MPEQKVSFGLGPSIVVVIWDAIGSRRFSAVSIFNGFLLTEENAWLEIFADRGSVLLDVALVVIERTILTSTA